MCSFSIVYHVARTGHIHLPGHGNVENQNLEEAVVAHVSARLTDGEKVEFVSKYLCEDYMENDEVRFSAVYNHLKVYHIIIEKYTTIQ